MQRHFNSILETAQIGEAMMRRYADSVRQERQLQADPFAERPARVRPPSSIKDLKYPYRGVDMPLAKPVSSD